MFSMTRMATICLSAVMVFFGSLIAALAADFEIQMSASESPSNFYTALTAASEHRISHPEDTIIINLPPHLTVSGPIRLGVLDSGAEASPLVIRGARNGGTVVTGAVTLESQPPGDIGASAFSRMQPAFRDKIRRIELPNNIGWREPAFSPHSSFHPNNPGRLFAYEGNRRLQAARWPSAGYSGSPSVVASDNNRSLAVRLPEDIRGLDQESDLWVTGFWGWNWWSETNKVASVAGRVIEFLKPEAPVRSSGRYFLSNIASGLDRVGVYYHDAKDESLYFIPDVTNGSANVTIAVADTLLQVTGAKNIRFENIAFEKSIGPAVVIENAQNIVISDCYVGHTGTDGIVIGGGRDVLVERCVLDDIGYTAISMFGGDSKTLAPAAHTVRDSSISRFGRELPSYRPGVSLQGVGLRIEGCEIFDGPHSGIIYSGNDHQISGNVLHDLALDTTDAGAIYAGRSWLSRGTVITSNFIYDVTNRVDTSASSAIGVYLDDQLSGTVVDSNVFRKVDVPIYVGGGRDNLIEDNLLLAFKAAPIGIDSRGLGWQSDMVKPGGTLRQGLESGAYREAPYADRYPNLATILEDQPGAPLHNRFIGNLASSEPIVAYDDKKTASFGVDTGNRAIGDVAMDFPASLDGVPRDARALPRLMETRTLIRGTVEMMKTLLFRDRLFN
jgi:hypothetical protein